jgi:hypothetical protein
MNIHFANKERAILATLYYELGWYQKKDERFTKFDANAFTTPLYKKVIELYNESIENDPMEFMGKLMLMEEKIAKLNNPVLEQVWLDMLSTNPVPISSMLFLYQSLLAESIERKIARRKVND